MVPVLNLFPGPMVGGPWEKGGTQGRESGGVVEVFYFISLSLNTLFHFNLPIELLQNIVSITRDLDNSREPGKIPGCQSDFPGCKRKYYF